MEWARLLGLVGDEPVFTSALLLAGDTTASRVRLQLSRWVKAGRLLQLRRGLYALAPAWRRVEPHPFLVANQMQRGSYVSLQSALAVHGVIPEHVPVVTSVGPGRPGTVSNPLGVFQFSHLARSLLFGYARLQVAGRQFAFVASPEKALLDLVYLTAGADSPHYLSELRLQNIGVMDKQVLHKLALRSGKPKLARASQLIDLLLSADEGELL
jgi:hypothetical protein